MKKFSAYLAVSVLLAFAFWAYLSNDEKSGKSIPMDTHAFPDPADRALLTQVEKVDILEKDILEYIRDGIFFESDKVVSVAAMNIPLAYTGEVTYEGRKRGYVLMPFGKTLFVDGINGVFSLSFGQRNPVDTGAFEPSAPVGLHNLELTQDPAFFKKLENMSTAELHEYAKNINWDHGLLRVTQIIHHPEIDRGTVLLLYWHGQPDYYAEFASPDAIPSVNFKGYEFVKKAEKRLLENQFASNDIRFSPMEDMFFTLEQISAIQEMTRIPDELKKPNR